MIQPFVEENVTDFFFPLFVEAPWTLNEASSRAFHNHWPVSLPQHLEKNVEPDKSALILGALKEWATNHATSDFYTLGLEIKLPTLKGMSWPQGCNMACVNDFYRQPLATYPQ